jgi:hypothetical protein
MIVVDDTNLEAAVPMLRFLNGHVIGFVMLVRAPHVPTGTGLRVKSYDEPEAHTSHPTASRCSSGRCINASSAAASRVSRSGPRQSHEHQPNDASWPPGPTWVDTPI